MTHQNVNWPTHTSPFSGGNRRASPHKANRKAKDLYSKRSAVWGGWRCLCLLCFCLFSKMKGEIPFIYLSSLFSLQLNQESTEREKKKQTNKQQYHVKEKKGEKIPKHLFQTTVLPNTQASPRNALLLFWNPTANYLSLIKKEGSAALSALASQTSGNSQHGSKRVAHNPDILP